ncbi:MAG TPA: hypothetical protein VJI67_00465 [archaeon]|nr:hypothetical protein [archaeon]HLD80393.1 hypothetical protein [archaeon]
MEKVTRKGYVFTLDAVLAFLMVSAMLALLYHSSFKAEIGSWESANLKRMANNIFTIMDRNEVLHKFSKAVLENDVNLYLPKNFQMRVYVERFEFNETIGEFESVDTLTIGPGIPSDPRNLVFGRRLFVTVDDARIEYYHNAEWWVWQK